LKSGSLNFREPSGPVQACNGIALPLPLNYHNQLFAVNATASSISGNFKLRGNYESAQL